MWKAIPNGHRPHLYAFAVGDDANTRLLQRVAGHDGVFEQVGSAESIDFKLESFIKKIGLERLSQVSLTVTPKANVSMVYRLEQDNFPGSLASWVGQYSKPGTADFTALMRGGDGVSRETAQTNLPKLDTSHPYLPATWARARVDALLMDREGEDKALRRLFGSPESISSSLPIRPFWPLPERSSGRDSLGRRSVAARAH